MKLQKGKIIITLVLCAILFSVCAQADTLVLPPALKTIEEEAFYGDTSLDEVVLPEGLESIGKKAFAGSSVKKINLPASLTSIADDAFSGCPLLRIATYQPYATRWAEAHGIPCYTP